MKKALLYLVAISLVIQGMIAGGCDDGRHDQRDETIHPPREIAPESHLELKAYLASLDYGWNNIDQGVPLFILAKLPSDLSLLSRPRERKRLFFLSLLPMALMINEEIELQRQQLEAIYRKLDHGWQLTSADSDLLETLSDWYQIRKDVRTDPAARRELLERVDIVPPSLLLAQAANESAYGTSRFAQDANNLFGEWTFTPGTGLIPEERPEGASYEVRMFPSVMDSLKSYVRNLNTHWAYQALRDKRARLRLDGKPVTGLDLVEELELYSARRQDYVTEIREIINYNRLPRLSRSTLRDTSNYEYYRRPKRSQTEDSQ